MVDWNQVGEDMKRDSERLAKLREHVEDGNPLVVLNKAGTVGHYLMGWNGQSLYCGRLSGGGDVLSELPDGARACATCVKVHTLKHAEDVRQAKQHAGYDLTLYVAGRETCRKCRVAKPHADEDCPDVPINERMRTEIRSWDGLTSPRLIWERVRLFKANTWRFTAKDRGVHLDGAHGWHNNYRVVDMALSYGMILDERDHADLAAYKAGDASDEANGAVIDQGGLVDQATEFLDEITEPGSSWEWDMGELSLVQDEDEEPVYDTDPITGQATVPVTKHAWEYRGQIRECPVCRLREAYWDDEAYPVDPCPGDPRKDNDVEA